MTVSHFFQQEENKKAEQGPHLNLLHSLYCSTKDFFFYQFAWKLVATSFMKINGFYLTYETFYDSSFFFIYSGLHLLVNISSIQCPFFSALVCDLDYKGGKVRKLQLYHFSYCDISSNQNNLALMWRILSSNTQNQFMKMTIVMFIVEAMGF